MATGMVGADVEQLRALAKRFDAAGNQLRQMSGTLTAQIQGTQAWQGGDAGRFRSEWSSQHRAQLTSAADALAQAAQVVNKNAEEQQKASDGAGGATGAVAGGAVSGQDHGGNSILDDIKAGLGVKGLLSNLIGVGTKAAGLTKFFRSLGGEEGLAGAAGTLLEGTRVSSLFGMLKAGPAGILGKVGLGGVLIGGAMSAFTGDGYSGLRGGTSRVLGGAAALGAGATLFAADTALMATGVGAPIAVGAMAAYGAWEAGNYIYDHRQAIGHFVSNAGHAVANVASGAAHAVSNVASGAVHAVEHLIPHVSIF